MSHYDICNIGPPVVIDKTLLRHSRNFPSAVYNRWTGELHQYNDAFRKAFPRTFECELFDLISTGLKSWVGEQWMKESFEVWHRCHGVNCRNVVTIEGDFVTSVHVPSDDYSQCIPFEFADWSQSEIESLSTRERMVVAMIAEGASPKEVGISVGLSSRSVQRVVAQIEETTHTYGYALLAKMAYQYGLTVAAVGYDPIYSHPCNLA